MRNNRKNVLGTLIFLLFGLGSHSAFSFSLEPQSIVDINPATHQSATPTLSGTVLWQGFEHSWDKTPHRLNQFGSAFLKIDFQSGDADENDYISTEQYSLFKVGEAEDEGLVKIKGQYLMSSTLGFHQDTIDESCLDVKGEIGDSGWIKCRVSVDLNEIGFEQYDQVTAILRGFQLKETSYSSGYNTRGFTLRLIPISNDGRFYVFDAFFWIHPEHSPDRPLASWLPLGDDCGKCDHYEYKMRVYYTLVGVNSKDGVLTDAETNGTNSYNQHIKMSPYKIPDIASTGLRAAHLVGTPDFDHGAVAIQGFSWRLNDWESTKKDGRYIRELRFDVSQVQYDSAAGEAEFFTNMYFSNSGTIPLGYDIDFKMWNVLIQTNDTHFALSPSAWESGRVQKGETKFEQELEYQFE